ncbi:MAG: hypothetical protein AAF208_02155 [Cyanobacteria bacterium P01_A01_bin.45]
MRTTASRISKHSFVKVGFEVIEVEIADCRGVQFERFEMQKLIESID